MATPATNVTRPGRSPAPTVLGALQLATSLAKVTGAAIVAAVASAPVPGRSAGHAFRTTLVTRLPDAGPAVVKFAQMIGARQDLLPPQWGAALSRLHADVPPMTRLERGQAWANACRQNPDLNTVDLTDRILGAGSIACVYEGVLDGTRVAVKLQRPGVAVRLAQDLRVLVAAGRLIERFPAAPPLGDLLAYMSNAIGQQVDFELEAQRLVRLRAQLSPFGKLVVVPFLYGRLVAPSCYVMELVDTRTGPPVDANGRAIAAWTMLTLTLGMVFRDGLVHCDLHPGNIAARDDGTIVVLDAGYMVDVPDNVRSGLEQFFLGVAKRDGNLTAHALNAAATVPVPEHRFPALAADMRAHVLQHTIPGKPFTMADFGQGIFDIQRRHRCDSRPEYGFPLMTLMVVEGTVRALVPDASLTDPLTSEAEATVTEALATTGWL